MPKTFPLSLFIMKKSLTTKLAALALAASLATPGFAGLYISFELTPMLAPPEPLTGASGFVGWDTAGLPGGSDLDGWNDLVTYFPVFGSLPTGAAGNLVSYWEFTVLGSSGDNWDAVLAGGSYQFDMEWHGNIEVPDLFSYSVFFSHIGAAAGSLGQWVQNNNSAATPGATVDPIWTYLQINDLDNLTGSSGFFAVLADDSNNVMGFQNGSGFLPTADGRGLLTAQAVPEPSTYGLIGALLLLGLIANRRLRAGRS